jgi:hypothetical protein
MWWMRGIHASIDWIWDGCANLPRTSKTNAYGWFIYITIFNQCMDAIANKFNNSLLVPWQTWQKISSLCDKVVVLNFCLQRLLLRNRDPLFVSTENSAAPIYLLITSTVRLHVDGALSWHLSIVDFQSGTETRCDCHAICQKESFWVPVDRLGN